MSVSLPEFSPGNITKTTMVSNSDERAGQKGFGQILINLLLAWAILACLSCQPDNSAGCFRGKGKESTQTRLLDTFHSMVVSDKLDIVLHQDSTQPYKCTLSGGSNLFPGIQTRVVDGVLHIEDTNTCDWVRDLQNRTRIDLWISDLNRIEMHGMSKLLTPKRIHLSDVELDFISSADQDWDLETNQLILNHSGVGEITVKGKAAVYVLTQYFVAGADARHLQSDYVFVYSYSTADAWVQPVKGLGAFIYNSGNIYHVSTPWKQIAYEKKGLGERVYAPAG